MKIGKDKLEAKQDSLPRVKRFYNRRLFMLVAGGVITATGVAMFVGYFFTQNMAFGGSSIFIMGGGFLLFKYYWGKTEDVVTEHIGTVTKVQVNSLCLYPEKVAFEDTQTPGGYPWICINDKKRYYVSIWNKELDKLVPFVLPDQQYYDPCVFAERVLELPAHQKIFTRKPNLFQKIKTGLLVLAIAIVWLLIITTTG